MAKDRKLYLNERTTIRDVAQEAGVSLTTVSHALNGYKDVSEKPDRKSWRWQDDWIICRMRLAVH